MSALGSLDLARFEALAHMRRAEFAGAEPFSHVVIDDLLRPEVADGVLGEFDRPEEGWTFLHHFNEHKRIFTSVDGMGSTSRAVFADLQSPGFLRALQALTGIATLVADPELDGGGLHETRPGGFLNVHADFLSHTLRPHWRRAINLILFLNHDWDESQRGWLELWDGRVTRCVRRIEPVFNRCIIFRVGRHSFHGVPAGVEGPAGSSRKSIALYYFVDAGVRQGLHPTHYVPRPQDPLGTRLLVRLDGAMVRLYSLLKRYTPLNDAVVGKLLKRIWRDRDMP